MFSSLTRLCLPTSRLSMTLLAKYTKTRAYTSFGNSNLRSRPFPVTLSTGVNSGTQASGVYLRSIIRGVKTSPGAAPRQTKSSAGGPVSWMGAILVLVVGSVVVYYFKEEKRKVKEAVTHKAKPIGMPRIGGPFELTDCATGKTVTDKDFHGKWLLIYFGFTFCPDVCPDELYKIADICNMLEGTTLIGEKLVPIFISIDPKRDTPEVVKEYVSEFHPRMVGLTGAKEKTDAIAKSYRVHTSEGPPMDDDPNDYIVDHSIITYLVDPQGVFQAFYGQNSTAMEVGNDIVKYVRNWTPRSDEQLAQRI